MSEEARGGSRFASVSALSWVVGLAAAAVVMGSGCGPSHPSSMELRGKVFTRVIDPQKSTGVEVSTLTPGGKHHAESELVARFYKMGGEPDAAVSKVNNWMEGTPMHIDIDRGAACRVFAHAGGYTVLSHVVMQPCGYKGVCGIEHGARISLDADAPGADGFCKDREKAYADLRQALDAL